MVAATGAKTVHTMKCLEMTEFVGFPNMGILVPYGITFDVVGVFGLAFQLLFKSGIEKNIL